MMSQVALEPESAVEDVCRRSYHVKILHQTRVQLVIVRGGTGRVELLQQADRTDVQRAGELGELVGNRRISGSGGGAPMEHPAT
jgi:hypothetical protein